jgi:hypothetical protein
MEALGDLLELAAMYLAVLIPVVGWALWLDRRENKRKLLAFAELRERLFREFPDPHGVWWTDSHD